MLRGGALVARVSHKHVYVGSIPAPATNFGGEKTVLSYKVSNVRVEGQIQVIDVWADSDVIYHTVRCLTFEPVLGLKSSVIYDLGHAVLYFNPRADDIESHVTGYLDYFCKEAEKEQDEKEQREAEELLEDEAA